MPGCLACQGCLECQGAIMDRRICVAAASPREQELNSELRQLPQVVDRSEPARWQLPCSYPRVAAAQRFSDLLAWQRCRELSRVIFEITETGPVTKNPRFRNQIRDAAQAVAPLIAEGFVRFLTGDFIRYLRMARAEIAEVQSDLDEAQERHYFSTEQQDRASTVARRAMFLTTRLLASKLKDLDDSRKQTHSRKGRRRRP